MRPILLIGAQSSNDIQMTLLPLVDLLIVRPRVRHSINNAFRILFVLSTSFHSFQVKKGFQIGNQILNRICKKSLTLRNRHKYNVISHVAKFSNSFWLTFKRHYFQGKCPFFPLLLMFIV